MESTLKSLVVIARRRSARPRSRLSASQKRSFAVFVSIALFWHFFVLVLCIAAPVLINVSESILA
jgi:uncharacterized membrane protein (DUF485 family)